MTEVCRPAFHVDTMICSGCKACQVACNDRNDLESGRLYRRVYEIAGGEWHRDGDAWRNDIFAYHLSISCNHCERPICVEGCPSGALQKREDGIVLLDDSICLGCGYCSWSCPYGAPQMRHDVGVMSKCDFCVEDMDAGVDPACVAACPVRAIDRVEAVVDHATTQPAIEPLPDPELTNPALDLVAHRDVDHAKSREFDLEPRPVQGLREWSLVFFTLLIQIAAGLSVYLYPVHRWLVHTGEHEAADAFYRFGLPIVPLLTIVAIGVSLLHLGRPGNMLRAVSNLRSSFLSREILLTGIFLGLGLWALLPSGAMVRGALLPAGGLLLIGGMARVYMLRTVPAWNRAATPLSFFGTGLLLGGLLTIALLCTLRWQAYGAVARVIFAAALGMELLRRSRFYGAYRRRGV